MELGIEVPGRVVSKGGGDHALVPGTDHRARRRVAHPGLHGVAFDPGKRPVDRLLVGVQDALVAAHHRHERHRLGRRQGHVAAGAMGDTAVDLPAPEPASTGHLAFEDPLEGLRLDRAGQPQRSSAFPTHALASLWAASSLA